MTGSIASAKITNYCGVANIERPPEKWAVSKVVSAAWNRRNWREWRARTDRHPRLLPLLVALIGVAALKWLAIPADIIVLIATATLVACLFAEATQEVISVRPFDLPKEMRREGWNGEITARHFADALRKIEIGARPRPLGVPQGMEPQSWSSEIAAGYFASALLEIEARPGQQAFPLRPERALPNIEVPQTGVSAAALV